VYGRGKAIRDWRALFYIAGDNSLSDAGIQDLTELCAARPAGPRNGDQKGVYVGVEIDTKGEHDGSIRYEITDEGHRTVIERLPEKDTGDPETLIEFLRWGFGRFPAECSLVVVWGHGEGFKLNRGIAYDDTGGYLDIPGIAQALHQVGASTENGNRKVDILGFDACLMSMVEIAFGLRNNVEILVGSQQTEPGQGWPYDSASQALRVAKDPEELAGRLVDLYIQRCRQDLVPNVTQSAIRLKEITYVVEALGALAKGLKELETQDDWEMVSKARLQTQRFAAPDYLDLIDFCEQLKITLPSLRADAEKVVVSADKAILASDFWGPSVGRAHGLSIWFPSIAAVHDLYRDMYRSIAAEPCPRPGCGSKVIPGETCRRQIEMRRTKAGGVQRKECGWECPREGTQGQGLLLWSDFLDEYRRRMAATESPAASATPTVGPSAGVSRQRAGVRPRIAARRLEH
jgi:cysteine peptidase C11 family protein